MEFVAKITNTELNSVSDNPLIFPDNDCILSGGNFHGEYTAKMCDFLAIALHELGSISETRIARLMNKTITGFETFLIKNPGLNSGLMMVHCTAASLVSENKQLCHPASVDTIPTSAGQEDHVSMGGWAARKLIRIVDNIQNVLAIELLSNLYAFEFLRPAKTTQQLERILSLAYSVAPVQENDSILSYDINKLFDLIGTGKLSDEVKEYL
jgi:Histidine ammonia-lyase